MNTIEAIQRRKSTRMFKNGCVNDSILDEILSAGLQAPSPKNDQPWYFLVLKNNEKKNEIANILEEQLNKLQETYKEMGVERKDIFSGFETVTVIRTAPVLVFVYLDSDVYEVHDDGVKWELSARDVECTHIMAVGAAIQNILLAATEKGVDSLWIGDFFFAYNEIKTYLGREGCVMAAVALGYGIETPYKSSRKKVDQAVTTIL
ncbi:MAG: nitroreductase family protein [Lachnospiraceae bacterium]|nr:nitroreductase family protein [Lachnospiraceae bacterium]